MQITYNAVVNPGDAKFRRLKLSNAKIKAAIVDTEGALATMRELGWQEGEEDGEAVLSLKGAATMAQVRTIQETQQAFKKKSAKDLIQRSKSAASLSGSEEQESLRQQLEADKAERAAREPVTKPSVAQPLPGSGANIATARDVGINIGCDC
ncbi:expressed protein [Chlorella variabilis]|uniref:Expressed protein n=1 Tax=Chlorella variabilis TaxID=554065 RepID=E1ZQ32_CHLVA|nr:expressed protein [Chlorella variabilis]EFN52168.1 expressed protein [Chlorella variabilis]|eukprot:XP_005844270.1 expressed protein [Chlorella variabilis]